MLVEGWGKDRRVAGDLFERLDIRELQVAGMTEIPRPVQAPGLSFDLGVADRMSAVLGKNTESLKALRDAMERAGGAAEVLRDSFRKNLAASLDGATLFGRPVKMAPVITRRVAKVDEGSAFRGEELRVGDLAYVTTHPNCRCESDLRITGVDQEGRTITMDISQALIHPTLTRD